MGSSCDQVASSKTDNWCKPSPCDYKQSNSCGSSQNDANDFSKHMEEQSEHIQPSYTGFVALNGISKENISNIGPISGSGANLTKLVNSILSDGRDHGFSNGVDSFKEQFPSAYQAFKRAGIITSNDAHEGIAQAGAWFKNVAAKMAGNPNVFSFNDDIYPAVERTGISRGDINTMKFVFDAQHLSEGRSDAELGLGDYASMGISGNDTKADANNLRSLLWVNEAIELL